MKCHSAIACFLFGLLLIAQAQSPDEQYLRVYNLIQEADVLADGGASQQAIAKYSEAQTILKKFKEVYPNWNERVISYRLNYVETKLAPLLAKLPPPSAVSAPPTQARPAARPEPAPAPSADLIAAQLAASNVELKRLQQANGLLEAKLREALSVQPVNTDPRELARAEERVRSLQKENELLKVSLDQQKAPAPKPAERAEAAPEKKAVTELKQKVAQQKDTIASLQNENEVLLKQAADLRTGANKVDTKTAQQLSEAQKNTAALQTANEKLQTEKASLVKQLADASKPAPTESPKAKDLESELKAATLENTKSAERLRKLENERAALEHETKELKSKLDGAATASKKSDAKKIKELEEENDDLKQRVNTLTKDLNRRSLGGRNVSEQSKQIETLRARLDVLEARQVPYTQEELALLKTPAALLAAPDPKAGKKSMKEIPPGAGPLVAEAQRAFQTRRFEDAEKKYLEVLRQDEKNIYILANLAAIQLELNKLDEAEKNLARSLALDPDDAFSLSMWGILKFRQKSYDEALNALSRSAKLDPDSAETQNYLGITLSQKGLRGPAETALRKAIQLRPRYPDAHHNLAVVYATHQPPSLELARWHYDKSIALGHARTSDLERILAEKKPATGNP
jgi:Tfp pilus assembly protein PilF